MNPTPENSSSHSDAPNVHTPNAQTGRRELTSEERALLPDFDDEARIVGTRVGEQTPNAAVMPDPKAAASDTGVLLGGALGGCFGNIVLGFVLLSFERAGLRIYGPGALAIILGVILLFLLVREWPRRVMLGGASFGISLLLSYALLYLLIRPALNSLNPGALLNVPPDEAASMLQVPQNAPQQSAPEATSASNS